VPGLVAAATGYVLFVGFGSWGGLDTIALAEPGLPVYDGIQPGDLMLAVAVGLVTALLIVVVRRLAQQVDRVSKRNVSLILLAGGLAVGIIAQVAGWLGADTQDVLFSGQTSVPAVVTEGSVGVVLVLVLAKALAYGVSLGCGFRGGPVFPAIFLGAGLATFPILWFDTSPTWAVAVGAAAGMAAGTRLVFAAVLLSALLVGPAGKDTIPAAVLAAATAWLTVVALQGRQPHPDEPAAPSEQAAPA
jgi:H+/Cl- antiporter ClcA